MTKNFSNQSFISLKLVGFNEEDSAKFKSILSIAEFRLDIPWQIVDSVDADFYLLSSRLRNQMDQNAILHSLPREKCIFCTHDKIDNDDNELILAGDNIPSLVSLVLLFNRLTQTGTASISQVNNFTPPDPQPTRVDYISTHYSHESSEPIEKAILKVKIAFFDPEQGLLGQLLSNEDNFTFFNLNNTAGSSKLYINVTDRTFYSSNKLEALDGLFSSDESLIPQSLTENELQQVILNEGLKAQPLDNLIWHITFNSSQGKIIKGYNPNDIVHLKRWPDITLPGCRSLIKLAAYMQSNAANLETAQQKTRFSIEQINNFYNACKVIGLIEQADQTDMHEKSLNDEKLQLFAQIGKRLNQ